jgi:hypothetical protein
MEVSMTAPLLEKVLDAHGGLGLWSGLTKITAHLSIGGPIWAAKGWADALVTETVEIETKKERSVISPFTMPGLRSVFEVGPERVTIESADGRVVERRLDARRAFKGFIRSTPWDILHLGYFVGYGLWNYLTTPFLFTYPDVEAREIDPWYEAGQTWRRLHVTFPASIATHSPRQVFYFDADGLQRRMDYVTEILGSTLVGHYTARHRSFGGLVVPTWRRVFRRNPDGTVNLNMPSITIDIEDVALE